VLLVANAVRSQSVKLAAVPFSEVEFSDNFWAERIKTNRTVTIPHALAKCEETGRISNFDKAAGHLEGEYEGHFFNDSDLYKIIEGAAHSLQLHPDAELEKYVDSIIDKIAAAQWEDGYLYAFYSVPKRQPEKRWTDTRVKHELYCAGHFFEAAVAYYQATGKKKALDVAIRFADYIDSVFGPDKKRDIPGHQEIEIGLVKLYLQTGNEKYFKLAKFFLDERGHARGRELYGEYCQDHVPVIEQTEAVGHSVRAGYLYSGMADVAILTGEESYVTALDRIWQDVVGKKLYITGGVGATGKGEAFGDAYYLPNEKAYCETCAAIANVFWNHRMFLLKGDAKYIDVLERVIYNGFLSGVSLEGDKFFYKNRLASSGNQQRKSWYSCACCPSNIVRFIPQIPGYAYAVYSGAVYINLFVGSSTKIELPKTGKSLKLKQQSNYPWDGDIKITVEPKEPAEFEIRIRIPGWAQNKPVPSDLYSFLKDSDKQITLTINDKATPLNIDKGFASIRRKWQKGDVIRLVLPMPIRRVLSDERVRENKDRVALSRGPIVYCTEGIDNSGSVHNIALRDSVVLKSEYRKDLLGAVTVLTGCVLAREAAGGGLTVGWERDFTALPYYAWAHRGKEPMAIWLARTLEVAQEPGKKP
jgi:DUF1680 family protein